MEYHFMKSLNLTTGSTFQLAQDDLCVFVATGVPTSIVLPQFPAADQVAQVKDSLGTAASDNITISGNGHSIDGALSYVISVNYGGATLRWSGTTWGVMA